MREDDLGARSVLQECQMRVAMGTVIVEGT